MFTDLPQQSRPHQSGEARETRLELRQEVQLLRRGSCQKKILNNVKVRERTE